jgi:hypothetical protein
VASARLAQIVRPAGGPSERRGRPRRTQSEKHRNPKGGTGVADVFISSASEDWDRARSLAKVLETGGLSVWWDRKIVPGQTFDQTIERELDAAKSAIVLWSTSSISSGWVKSEASAARQRGILVPAMIDDVKIPLGFRDIQCANLVGWSGDFQRGVSKPVERCASDHDDCGPGQSSGRLATERRVPATEPRQRREEGRCPGRRAADHDKSCKPTIFGAVGR